MPITPPPMTMALLPVRSVETPCLLMTPSGSAIGRGELLRACRLLLMVGGLADAEGVGEGSQEVASYVSGASGWRILPSRWPWPASDTIVRIVASPLQTAMTACGVAPSQETRDRK